MYLPHMLILLTGNICWGDITIRYDSGYLTCSKKLTGSQLSLPQKLKHSIDTWDRTPQGISDKATDQWQIRLRSKAKGRHFVHLLWFSHTTGSEQLQTHQNRFFSEPLTLLRGRQQNWSVLVWYQGASADEWYTRVQQLRREADDYKRRGQQTHFSREHLAQLATRNAQLWDVVSNHRYVRPSVCLSVVCPCVCLSVCPSVLLIVSSFWGR